MFYRVTFTPLEYQAVQRATIETRDIALDQAEDNEQYAFIGKLFAVEHALSRAKQTETYEP